MGEGHRVLGDYRGGSDMRVGSLVKHIEYGFIGVLTNHQANSPNWFVVWNDNVWNCWCVRCELEVICE